MRIFIGFFQEYRGVTACLISYELFEENSKIIKQNENEPICVMKTNYVTNILTDYEESLYKFILIIDGHLISSNLSFHLYMKSCILLQESKYKLWYSDLLIPMKHYIPIKNDLSDLMKQIKWCLKNDEKCKKYIKLLEE